MHHPIITGVSCTERNSAMIKLANQLDVQRCPHCGVDRPSLIQQNRFETANYMSSNARTWATYVCSRCGMVVTAWCTKGDGKAEVQAMFPSADSVDDAIPGKAKQFLEQALNSLSAPAGAVMLAASAVDAMLKEKNYVEGSLYSRIDKAASDGLITKDMAEWAHEVRLDANDQRHADSAKDLPTEIEARSSIDFVKALGQFMFILPSRVKRGIQDAKGS